MPLPILQKVLGHSSIRTTALYWKNSEDPKEQIIIDLKNDKKDLEKQLIQTQQEKDNLLKLLSIDLQVQYENSLKQDSEKLNNQELHQQLIAQIQVITKY